MHCSETGLLLCLVSLVSAIKLPRQPINLGVSNIKESSALVQFYPGSGDITDWIIEGQEGYDHTWKEISWIPGPDANSIQVYNLRPYTLYVLRIIAVNDIGRSNPSLPTRYFKTLQAPPRVPPDNVTLRAVNSTALRVSWTPLTKQNGNGIPRGYKIYYKLKEDSLFSEVTLNMDTDSYILGNLQESMIYEVKVMAFNDVGSSPYSPVTSERTRNAISIDCELPIVFRALKTKNENVRTGAKIRFENTGLNIGNGYNSSTGIFTAPTDGIYIFSWTIVTKERVATATGLVVNGQIIAKGFADARDSKKHMDDSSSNTVPVAMNRGETASIRITKGWGTFVDGQQYSSFSGWKLS